MPDSIRTTIKDALVAAYQGITVANGYRTTISNVEIVAKTPSEAPEDRNWVGLIVGAEDYTDEPGTLVTVANWTSFAFLTASARTQAAVHQIVQDFRNDQRKALYSTPQLGVEGVHYLRLVRSEGAESSPQWVAEGCGVVATTLIIKFDEGATDA